MDFSFWFLCVFFACYLYLFRRIYMAQKLAWLFLLHWKHNQSERAIDMAKSNKNMCIHMCSRFFFYFFFFLFCYSLNKLLQHGKTSFVLVYIHRNFKKKKHKNKNRYHMNKKEYHWCISQFNIMRCGFFVFSSFLFSCAIVITIMSFAYAWIAWRLTKHKCLYHSYEI